MYVGMHVYALEDIIIGQRPNQELLPTVGCKFILPRLLSMSSLHYLSCLVNHLVKGILCGYGAAC